MDKKPAIRFASLLSGSVDSTNLQNDIVVSVFDCDSAFLISICFNIHSAFYPFVGPLGHPPLL
jgi:hypothetical protein